MGGRADADEEDEFNTGTGGLSLGAPIGTNPGRDPDTGPPPPAAALVRLVLGVTIWTLTPVEPGTMGRAFGCGYASGVSSGGYEEDKEEEEEAAGGPATAEPRGVEG